jgi:hypothetical protein
MTNIIDRMDERKPEDRFNPELGGTSIQRFKEGEADKVLKVLKSYGYREITTDGVPGDGHTLVAIDTYINQSGQVDGRVRKHYSASHTVGLWPAYYLSQGYTVMSAANFLTRWPFVPKEREFVWYLRKADRTPLGCVVGSSKGIGWSYCDKHDTFTKKEAKAVARARMGDFVNVPKKLQPLIESMASYLKLDKPQFIYHDTEASITNF